MIWHRLALSSDCHICIIYVYGSCLLIDGNKVLVDIVEPEIKDIDIIFLIEWLAARHWLNFGGYLPVSILNQDNMKLMNVTISYYWWIPEILIELLVEIEIKLLLI